MNVNFNFNLVYAGLIAGAMSISAWLILWWVALLFGNNFYIFVWFNKFSEAVFEGVLFHLLLLINFLAVVQISKAFRRARHDG